MKKIVGVTIIVIMVVLTVPSAFSFEPEKGFYAEYEMYRDPDNQDEFWSVDLRGFDQLEFHSFTYKYQVLDIQGAVAYVRMCFEGEIYTHIKDEEGNIILLPFKRIFDIRVNLDTLEMMDENGAWGKWIFWINPASYGWKEYTLMKNWNDHGEVKAWLNGPSENVLSSCFHSSYGSTLTHYISLVTEKEEITEEGTIYVYPRYEEYGIPTREDNFYSITTDKGEVIELEPGLDLYYFYTDEGMLFETISFYLDDFLDQRLGIVLLPLDLFLTDYGVSEETLIEEPKPEYQKSTFDEELAKIEELKEQQKLAEKTQTPEKTPQKREQEQQDAEEKENPLIYLVPILIVVVIVAFIIFKEKR